MSPLDPVICAFLRSQMRCELDVVNRWYYYGPDLLAKDPFEDGETIKKEPRLPPRMRGSCCGERNGNSGQVIRVWGKYPSDPLVSPVESSRRWRVGLRHWKLNRKSCLGLQ
jgi:hypothetical protein